MEVLALVVVVGVLATLIVMAERRPVATRGRTSLRGSDSGYYYPYGADSSGVGGGGDCSPGADGGGCGDGGGGGGGD